jgi:ADP-ribosylglycohydrolase
VDSALSQNLPVRAACNRWYSGAYLLETVPSVRYILCRHGENPEEALIRAVNDTKDNDTVAAIVGAALGAFHGRSAWPHRWVVGLLERLSTADDGRLFTLIEASQRRWGSCE